MPFLPELMEGATTRQMIEVFAGYNHNMRINQGEWYNAENLSSARYPLFARRNPRKLYKDNMVNPLGMIAKDALAYVDGTKLIYNGKEIDGIELSTAEEDCPKQLVSMGAFLCVFPDAVYVNTADLTDRGTMGAMYESVADAAIKYSPCRIDGTDYENVYISDTKPENPENGQYWLDTSGSTHMLKQYSSTNSAWIEIPTVYTRIEVAGIGTHFKDYDGVTISGAAIESSNEGLKAQIAAINTDMIIQKSSTDYIIVTALIDEAVIQQSGSIKVERKIPKMNFVCEANNRLWGCYYGMSNGKVLNEIYSCKLGDFKNWNCFMGISTDSYTVSIGTDGEFTGCIAYGGYPIFFKENYVHKVYGMQPSAYQVQSSPCRGVQRGSHRSMVVVNEVLYYKSRKDVCAYDGSLPVGVSSQLGEDQKYYEASAGAHGGKYYISMRDAEGAWHLFAYDTKYSIWHREDTSHVGAFAAWGDSLYMMDVDKKQIWDINGGNSADEGEVRWMAESGLIGYEMIDHKYVSRFNFRMKLGVGAECKLEIEYDSDGVWHDQGVVKSVSTNSFILPVIPRRCDHFRLRLSGVGEIYIYSLAKHLEQGSDA